MARLVGLVGLVLAMVGGLAAPGGAVGREEATATAPDRPAPPASVRMQVADGQVDTDLPLDPVEDLLRGLGRRADRRDLTALGDRLRSFLAEEWDVDVPQPLDEEDEHDDEMPWIDEEGVWAWAYPGGDLDGDSRQDALVSSERWPEGTYALEARRGIDGTLLWRSEASGYEDLIAWPAGDLTGDGVDDLLVWLLRFEDFEWEESCTAFECIHRDRLTYTWRVGTRSGADNAALWSEEYAGEEELEIRWRNGLGVGPYDYTFRWEATNVLVLPFLSGDHDGDDLPDIALNALDVVETGRGSGTDLFVAGTGEGDWSLRASTRAAVVSGVTGATALTRVVEDAPGVGLLRPLGGGDLLWSAWAYEGEDRWDCAYVLVVGHCFVDEWSTMTVEAEVLDGQTLQPRWQRRWGDLWAGAVVGVGADLDGDGAEDLAMVALTPEWHGGLEAVAGGDGATLWQRTADTWLWPVPAGQLDGGPGADLLLLSAWYDWEEEVLSWEIDRVDGASGATLLSTRGTAGPDDADMVDLWLWPAGDGDGDGAVDIATEVHRWSFEEPVGCEDEEDWDCDDWWGTADARSTLSIESGLSGDALLERSYDDFRYLWPAADLDGDGAEEIFLLAWDWESDDGPSWEAVRMVDDTTLWSMQPAGWLEVAGDQDGGGGAELLLNEFDWEAATSRVSSLHGATALPRWSLIYE